MADPASLGVTAALTALNMAMTASRTIEGPRLDSLDVTTASYGAALNYFYGTRRFDGCSVIFAEPIREEPRRNKTKGGKYNDYKYYGTWAVVVADQQIDAVTRIWFDRHLVYDASGVGPISPFQIDDRAITDYIRIYLGTETQEPDPRIQATIDALHGEGSTPAYRGIAYIMFEEMPLEKLGNRLPQVSVEATRNGAPAFPVEAFESPNGGPANFFGFGWSPDRSRFILKPNNNDGYEIWDNAARSLMISGSLPSVEYTLESDPFTPIPADNHDVIANPMNVPEAIGIANDGTIYLAADWSRVSGVAGGSDPLGSLVIAYPPDGVGTGAVIAELPLYSTGAVQVIGMSDGTEHICVLPQNQNYLYDMHWPIGGFAPLAPSEIEYIIRHWFADLDDNLWSVGRDKDTPSVLVLACGFGARAGEKHEITMPASEGGKCGAYHYRLETAGIDQFVVAWGNGLYLIDAQTFAINATVSQSLNTDSTTKNFMWARPGQRSIWVASSTSVLHEYSSVDLTEIREYSVGVPDTWDTAIGGHIYDPINHAFLGSPSGGAMGWLYIDRVAGNGVTLGSIFDDVTARVGLTPGTDTDSTALTQNIKGYSFTQGTAKAVLEPLFEFHDADVRPHDFKLQGVNRGSASGGTITTPYMGAAAGAGGKERRYTITRTLDTDLPFRVNVSFADPAIDQQSNSVPAQRAGDATDGAREVSIDLTTLVLDIDEARRGAERILRRRWFERDGVETSLGRRHIGLEPADIRTLDLDGILRTVRLQRMEVGANGVITTAWLRDAPSIAVLSGAVGAPADGHTPPVVNMPGITRGFVLDIPLLTDAHDASTPTMYFAASSYSSDVFWPGATFYTGTDYSTSWDEVAATSRASWGLTEDALGEADPHVWDRGSSVTVQMKVGTLSSASEATLLTSPTTNLALIGDELVQFANATLNVDGTYTLDTFLRGRRGTEWAIDSHSSGETFLLMSGVDRHEMGASDVGDEVTFKAATIGRPVTSAFPITFDYTGASLKPYAPAQVEGERDGSGNLTISWVRRTRVGGAWRDGSDVPLGEASEAYEVEILNGASVVHTITGLTSPTATLSAADQTTYLGAPSAAIDVRVYQLSATVGRGFAAEATV